MLEQLEVLWGYVTDAFSGYGPRILGGFAILAVGWLFSIWVERALRRLFDKSDRLDKTVEQYLTQLSRITILLVAGIAALSSFGVQTASIIAVLGAMGLAIGLALQGTLSNVASGIVLLVLGPFRVDDWVKVSGSSGKVIHIGLFATRLETGDGLFVMIPNAKIWGDEIVNYTRNDTRRMEMVFGIAYHDDIDRAIELIRGVVVADERVLADPEPTIVLKELGQSSVNILTWAWVKREDFFKARAELTKQVKEVFDAEDITIPYPQRDVRIIREADRDAA